MSSLDQLDNEEVIIESVQFGIDTIIIHFQEKRHVGPRRIRSSRDEILIDSEVREEQYLRLQEILRDMVDGTYEEDDNEY